MISYIHANSPLHKLDPRIKLLYLILFLLALILKQSLEFPLLSSAVILLLYRVSNIPLSKPLRDLGQGWLFVLLPPILRLAIAPSSWFFKGVLTSIFLLNIFLASLLMIYTTEIGKLMQALVFFKLPSELAFILMVSIHFIPFLQQELERIRISQALRAYSPTPFSLPLPLIIPLLHSSLGRASQLAVSLESRGFNPERINMEVELRMGLADYLLLLLLPFLVFIIF